MRKPLASWALGVAFVAAGCASRRPVAAPVAAAPCGPACGPVCVTEVRRAPTCCQVTLPPRCEKRLSYRPVPAECRTREMPDYGLCLRTSYEERCVPETQAVEVPDYCETLIPTCTIGCAPVMGYRAVTDFEDRIAPICEPHRTPVLRTVPVPVCGCVCDPCGRPTYGTVGVACETQVCGTECRMRKTGERLTQVPVGQHLEQVQVTQGRVVIPTGSRPARMVVGSHYEHVVVGHHTERVVTDKTVEWRQTGSHREQIVKRPCRLEAYEEEFQVPGECVWVCDDPRHQHAGRVMSSAEYESLTGRRVP